MAQERNYEAQGPFTFTVNGGADGKITLNTVGCLKVRQTIKLSSIGQPNLLVEIKRVISPTEILVGPQDKDFNTRLDVSMYTVVDSAAVFFAGASKPKLKVDDIWQAVYEQEPTVALRTFLVDNIGRPIDTVIGPDGKVRLATDAAVTVSGISVDLDALTPPTRPDPDNSLIVGSLDGTKTGLKAAFVNNIRLQILAAHDRDQEIIYSDFGTKNQRITQIDYTSPTFPGVTARKTIVYSLIGNKYRRDNITWSIV